MDNGNLSLREFFGLDQKLKNYNEDWEKENDKFDSMQKGKECNGSYCQNCDYCNTCTEKPEDWCE